MFGSNSYLQKFTSAGLLTILLFIHSVKLLHTHSNNTFIPDNKSAQVKKQNESEHHFSRNADCNVCNYQLARDGDQVLIFREEGLRIYSNDFTSFSSDILLDTFYSFFESRGPPSVC